MYYVYILLCADSTLYTGITTDLDRRLVEHQNGEGAKYTRARGAKALVYSEEYPDRSSAQIREAEIKHMTRKEKLLLVSTK